MHKQLGSDIFLQGTCRVKAFLVVIFITMNKFLNRNSMNTIVLVEVKLLIPQVNFKVEISSNDDSSADFRGSVISCSTRG